MTSLDKHFDAPASDDFTAPAVRKHGPLYAEMPGKISRFLARSIGTKRIMMRNTEPLVSFTFDDVAASTCRAGAEIVQHYQARATFYISGGRCGAASPTGRLASVDQIKALHANGHEIGCHTYSHASVVALSRAALVEEIQRNRTFLQGVLGNVAIRNFAYPYGDLSFATKRYLATQFDSCRSPIPGVNAGVADLAILRSHTLEDATITCAGIRAIIAENVRRNGWLLFASHDVDNAPSRYGVRPELLAFALRSAQEVGCQLVTVAQAVEILRGAAPSGST